MIRSSFKADSGDCPRSLYPRASPEAAPAHRVCTRMHAPARAHGAMLSAAYTQCSEATSVRRPERVEPPGAAVRPVAGHCMPWWYGGTLRVNRNAAAKLECSCIGKPTMAIERLNTLRLRLPSEPYSSYQVEVSSSRAPTASQPEISP